MKIYLKTDDGHHFFIPVLIPYRCMGLFGCKCIKKLTKKYAGNDVSNYMDSVDMKEFSKAMAILSKYKGLELVDVKDKDGTHVRIVV